MTATLTAANATQPIVSGASFATVDPCLARAEYFFDLELMELSATIPQATARPAGVAKY